MRISEAHSLEEADIRAKGKTRPAPPLTTRIYIANLPYDFSVTDVRALFAQHDLSTTDVYLMTDKKTGRSRGAGFVEMISIEEASQAIGALDGLEIKGRRLTVRPADLKER